MPEDMRIVYRPEEVTHRQLPGHWEDDFIKGAYNHSAVGTPVERKTPYVVCAGWRMRGRGHIGCLHAARPRLLNGLYLLSAGTAGGEQVKMKKLPAFLHANLTYDRGGEMACFERLAERLQLDIWFTDPHVPWQPGSNENTNGLLRQFLPKRMDLSAVSQVQLNDIARPPNGQPRKTFGWKTPEKALAEEMRSYSQQVALDS